MAENRTARVRLLIAQEPQHSEDPGEDSSALVGWLRQLCHAAVRALPVTGAGVSVMSVDGLSGVAAVTDITSEWLEELQFTVGEGPCIDAFSSRRPVLEPDLTDGARIRWPGYAPAAAEHGVRAVFAFPLQIGAVRVGVLDLYVDASGPLPPEDLALALTFAEVAAVTLVDGQTRTGHGEVSAGLDEALGYRSELYQAQGMVMVQLGVDLTEAMARLRAHAYAVDRRLAVVAADVVGGRLRLDPDEAGDL